MDSKSKVSWLFRPTELMVFVKLKNAGSGPDGDGGDQCQILLHMYHQWRESSAMEIGADVERGEVSPDLFLLRH